MADFKIVAQGRPNLTGDYKFEMEGLQGLDFQIMEVPAVSDDEFLGGAHDADALITRDMPVSQKVIDGLEKCKIIALDSVGTDLVDVPAATARGIPVTNCPDTFVQEVAEHTAALILAAHRRLLLVDKMVRGDRWAEGRPALCQLPRLYGQTLGLISFGNIARAVVPLMKAFGVRILAYDPFVRETVMVQYGVEPVGLTELLQRSDIVSNHLPGTGGTRRMIGEEQFRLMKPQAIFVNTGRGATVDEPAMTRALEQGWIGHAALDVLETEPPDPSNPLLGLENVTLTAHVASASSRYEEGARIRVGREIALVLRGRWPMSCVNQSVLDNSGLLRWLPA